MKIINTWPLKITALLFLLVLSNMAPVKADQQAPMGDFSVKAVPAEKQLDKDTYYFNLNVSKPLEQTLKVVITNNSNHKIKIQQNLYNATTGDSGNVVYGENKNVKHNDPTLRFPLKTIVSLTTPKVIEVAAHSSATATAKMQAKLPADFAGMILGGWEFVNITAPSDTSASKQSGISVASQYAYNIAIAMVKDRYVTPTMQLGTIKPGAHNYKRALLVNLQNTSANLIGGLAVNATVTRQGSSKAILTQNDKDFSLAPNSNFNYGLMYAGKDLVPGKYHLRLHAQSGQFKWDFDRDFTITASDVRQANKAALYDAKPGLALVDYCTNK